MALKIGDNCPSFSLPNQHGNTVTIDELIGSKILIVYFYPKDDTTGCTKEACAFRDSYEDLKDLGCEVIGISSDSIEDHKKFAESHRLSFTLLADSKKAVRKLFGVPSSLFGLIPGRVTYVIDKQGKINQVFNSLTDTQGHINAAVAAVQLLKQQEV